MSEKSYLDSLLEGITDQEDVSLSDEELNNLDIGTVKDVELADFDISDIDLSDIGLSDMDLGDISEISVEGTESEAFVPEQEETLYMDKTEDMAMETPVPEKSESMEMDVPVPEESEGIEMEVPVPEESDGLEMDVPVPEESEDIEMEVSVPEESEDMEMEVPLMDMDNLEDASPEVEEKEPESDGFMEDVDSLLNMLSDDTASDNSPAQNDDPESFFSLDGLMAMDGDDAFFDEEDSALKEASPSTKEENPLAADGGGEENSLEDDLMGILNESPKEEQQPKKKGIFNKLFANVHDAKSKRAHEKMLSDEERKALRKKEREEKKAAKKAMKEDPAYIAEQEAKKKEKEEKKAQVKAAKEAKKREKEELKKQRQAEEEAEAMKDQGRINRVGAAIVFICLGAFAGSVIFGSNNFSYNQSVAKAEEYFANREYTEAYNELRGIDFKSEDVEMYDKIVTVMYVNKQLNSYNNYYAMQMYPEALDSLLKGLEKYDRYLEVAGQLGITEDLNYVRAQIVDELQTVFSLNEKEAYEIINMGTKEEYSQKVIEAAKGQS